MAAIETRESCSTCSLYKCGLLDVSHGIDGSFATLSHCCGLPVKAGFRECLKILDRAPLEALDHFSILWFEEPHPIDFYRWAVCEHQKTVSSSGFSRH